MTAARVYRAGLGLPPAVTITSDPLPPPARASLYAQDDISAESSGSTIYQPKPRYPQGYTSYAQWKEWHINPTQHGPEGSRGPPAFVPSTTTYDELGRSMLDGVEVQVDDGAEGDEEGKEDGPAVAEWYDALARTGSAYCRNGFVGEEDDQPGPSRRRKATSPVIIDLTGEDEDEMSTSSMVPAIEGSTSQANLFQPIRVHRNEWFIRRALANSSTASSSSPFQSKPSKHSSIGSLLRIPPIQNRALEPVYVLGPENKGHQILRERLGWGGGGLGRPEGWQSASEVQRAVIGSEEHGRASVSSLVAEASGASGGKESAIVLADESDEDEPAPDPCEAGHLDDLLDHTDLAHPPDVPGPGRTAPIATALKLDRLGLGYRFERPPPRTAKAKAKAREAAARAASGSSGSKDEAGGKRVTHTHAQILEAQRRARSVLSGAVHWNAPSGGSAELGKKGKVRWKEHDKREREERRRMISALNE